MLYRYIGDGAHYPGVPARALSAEEVAALSPEQQADVYSGHAYRAEDDAPAEEVAPTPEPAPAEPPAGEYVVEPPAEGQTPHADG
jgi:hypothetical protein